MATELKEYGFNFKQCYRVFGMTYNQTIKSFGWEISGRNPILKSDKELVDDYIQLYEELGRIPMFIDIDHTDNMANSQTYKRRIGDILEICKVCNIEITNMDLINQKSGCGIQLLDDNGDICLSQPELLISNFLIENNINYIKEYKYSKVMEGEDPRRSFDWFLKDLNVFVEYFGMYDIRYVDSDNWKGKYTRKALDKIKKCKLNNITLISLFPEDINDDMLGVKNKIMKHNKNT